MANTERMTIHKALAELKIINGRIHTAVNGTTYVVHNRHSNLKIQGLPISEYVANMENSYKSAVDLISRRDALKRAVVLSNAVTKVTIGDIEYSVAEAIEMKNTGIENKQLLLNVIRNQYNRAKQQCDRENEILPSKADKYITDLYSTKDLSKMSEEMQASRDKYIQENTFTLVESIKVLEVITKLEADIAAFTSEVDSALSVSNALTEIEFSY